MLCERNQIKEIHIVCSRTHTAEFMSQFRIGKTTAAEGRPVLARGRRLTAKEPWKCTMSQEGDGTWPVHFCQYSSNCP